MNSITRWPAPPSWCPSNHPSPPLPCLPHPVTRSPGFHLPDCSPKQHLPSLLTPSDVVSSLSIFTWLVTTVTQVDSLFLLTFPHTHTIAESPQSLCVPHPTHVQPTFHSSHCWRGIRHCSQHHMGASSLRLGFLSCYDPWAPAQHPCLGTSEPARKLTSHRAVLNQEEREAGGSVTPFARQF